MVSHGQRYCNAVNADRTRNLEKQFSVVFETKNQPGHVLPQYNANCRVSTGLEALTKSRVLAS